LSGQILEVTETVQSFVLVIMTQQGHWQVIF